MQKVPLNIFSSSSPFLGSVGSGGVFLCHAPSFFPFFIILKSARPPIWQISGVIISDSNLWGWRVCAWAVFSALMRISRERLEMIIELPGRSIRRLQKVFMTQFSRRRKKNSEFYKTKRKQDLYQRQKKPDFFSMCKIKPVVPKIRKKLYVVLVPFGALRSVLSFCVP